MHRSILSSSTDVARKWNMLIVRAILLITLSLLSRAEADDGGIRGFQVADLAITKTDGITIVVPGQVVTYTIVVTNSSDPDVMGATVVDPFPAELSGMTYTSVAAGGATGNTAAGVGDINDLVNMPSGSSITYTATGTLDPAAVGTLENTATVTAPAGIVDNDLTNNSATDIDDITPTADLSITKDDGLTTISPGETLTYEIVVSNAGPSDAVDAVITDVFPAELTNVSYTSAAAGGATGNSAAGNGDINDTLTMPVGSTITYMAMGTVAADASGTIDNTANIDAAAGLIDPDLTNNSANDIDTIPEPAPEPEPEPEPQPVPCPANASGLNLLFSLLFHAPVCGFGCPMMLVGTFCGMMALRSGARRRLRSRKSRRF